MFLEHLFAYAGLGFSMDVGVASLSSPQERSGFWARHSCIVRDHGDSVPVIPTLRRRGWAGAGLMIPSRAMGSHPDCDHGLWWVLCCCCCCWFGWGFGFGFVVSLFF